MPSNSLNALEQRYLFIFSSIILEFMRGIDINKSEYSELFKNKR